jgi:hypothetical protein
VLDGRSMKTSLDSTPYMPPTYLIIDPQSDTLIQAVESCALPRQSVKLNIELYKTKKACNSMHEIYLFTIRRKIYIVEIWLLPLYYSWKQIHYQI